MPTKKLKEFLDQNKVKYVTITHSTAYTAQEIASLTHIKGKELAKTVIVRIDGALAMAVIPASLHVDLDLLRAASGARAVELATEQEFKDKFPDCETGAMPPFGNLYGMEVYADPSLGEHEEITFNAGTHRELMRMAWADVVRLGDPKVVNITHRPAAAAA